jgi:hypothetical protein
MGVPLGWKHSAESLEKMRQAQRGRRAATAETRARMRKSALAKPKISEETRERIRLGQLHRRKREAIDAGISEEEFSRQECAGNKWCSHCKLFFGASEFHDARKRICNACNREKLRLSYERNRDGRIQRRRGRYAASADGEREKARAQFLKKYGLTIEEYERKLLSQSSACAICRSKDPGNGVRFAVDHDHRCCAERKHSCGKCVRGLLCARCNQALERIENAPIWLEQAASYLRSWRRDLG